MGQSRKGHVTLPMIEQGKQKPGGLGGVDRATGNLGRRFTPVACAPRESLTRVLPSSIKLSPQWRDGVPIARRNRGPTALLARHGMAMGQGSGVGGVGLRIIPGR